MPGRHLLPLGAAAPAGGCPAVAGEGRAQGRETAVWCCGGAHRGGRQEGKGAAGLSAGCGAPRRTEALRRAGARRAAAAAAALGRGKKVVLPTTFPENVRKSPSWHSFLRRKEKKKKITHETFIPYWSRCYFCSSRFSFPRVLITFLTLGVATCGSVTRIYGILGNA